MSFVALAALLLCGETIEAKGLLRPDHESTSDDKSIQQVPWDYPLDGTVAAGPSSWEARLVRAEQEVVQTGKAVEEFAAETLVIVEHPFRTRAGRVGASVLLLAFIFFFGCCWDDQEGLPPHMADRLMQEDLWSTQGQAFSKKRVAVVPVAPPDEDMSVPLEICKAFVVPSSSTKLSVPIASWHGETPWLLNVLGFMGTPLLVASMRIDSAGRRILEVSAPGGDGVALASAILLHDDCERLVIRDSFGDEFGELAGDGCGGHVLHLAGRPALAVTADSDGTPVAITSVPGSKQLATAVRRGGSPGLAAEHFEFTVRPGADLVLILVCALASQAFAERGRCLPVFAL